MGKNKSYNKGYRNENKMQTKWRKFFSRVDRSHQSGAYTGDCDLTVLHRLRFWKVDCKSRKDDFKRDYARFEKADILADKSDGKERIIKMLEAKFLEFNGLEEIEIADEIE